MGASKVLILELDVDLSLKRLGFCGGLDLREIICNYLIYLLSYLKTDCSEGEI